MIDFFIVIKIESVIFICAKIDDKDKRKFAKYCKDNCCMIIID